KVVGTVAKSNDQELGQRGLKASILDYPQ
ncbi:hypothetical protein TNIN_273721, partial [Trichonephila inaurata madagascariensis]